MARQYHWEKLQLDLPTTAKRLRKEVSGLLEIAVPQKSLVVARVTQPFAVQYELKASPVLYIGCGKVDRKLDQVLDWLGEHARKIRGTRAEIWLMTFPDTGDGEQESRRIERDLLLRFRDSCGGVPLFNSKRDIRDAHAPYRVEKDLKKALSFPKKPLRFAIVPLPPDSAHLRYQKGRSFNH
ncbi:MAG: hypothetical protein ACPGOV_06795 [Magnetovibrionaceae bacterium]